MSICLKWNIIKISSRETKNKNISSLASIAPFIDEEAMGKLVLDFYTNETGKDIASLAPFIEEEMLLEIAVKSIIIMA